MANIGFRDKDQAAWRWLDDCLEQANKPRQELEPQWYENWANYRVESYANVQFPNKQYPMAVGGGSRFDLSPINYLKTPESHQGVNTLRALLLASLFGTRDYVQADPVGDEDIEKAKRVSRLVMYGLERPGNYRTNYETLGDGLIFGLGSYSARWRSESRLVPRRMPVPDPSVPGEFLRNPETGSIMTILTNIMAPIWEDPCLETDDLFDTWFDPSANRFDQLKYKIKRFLIRDEELRALKNDENWDSAGISEVLRHAPGGRISGPDRDDHPKLLTENLSLDHIKDVADYGYYGGWMFEGQIPEDIAKEIGGIDARGTIVLRMVDGVCIQSIQSPQRNGHIQGGSITILPSGRGIYGISPLTIVRYLQDVSDTQLILTVQALIESVYQNYVVNGDWGPNFQHDFETRRPREVFVTQGEITQLAPVPKDYAGLNIAVGALNLISQTMRNAMNARDPVQGIFKQTGDTTATETQIVASSAMHNTDQLAVLIEREELPTEGRLVNDLYYVNLEDEAKIFRRVGDTETTSVSYFDIDATTDITFMGARLLLSKQGISNQFRDMAGVLTSNPFTAAATDWHAFITRWADEGFQVKGFDQLMIKNPEEIVARMQAMGLANTVGRSSGGGPGPGGGAPAEKGRANPGNGGRTGGVVPFQAAGEAS